MNDENRPEDAERSDDRFLSRLEAVDQRMAAPQDGQAGDVTIEPEMANVANVLKLINRVRSRELSTARQSNENSDNAAEETMASDAPATGAPATGAPASGEPVRVRSSHVGRRVGPYEILEQIAHGGMGIVFRARDTQLNRIVALKMMLAGPFAYREERRRFRVEAEAAAQLDHPGIVPVYDVGEHSGQLFFTMGFVDGVSLSQQVNSKPLDARSAARIASEIAAAVDYAHQRGVIHRDIKPANVLIDSEGRPRITDFGLARRTDTASDLTRSEQVLGTPSYMSPEQAAGQNGEIGPASDVYSIGATLYCMLTGGPPFQAAGAVETLRLVIEKEPLSPRQHNPSIPVDLDTICLKCLQKEPHRRYTSAAHCAADLQRFLEGQPIEARPIGLPERGLKWARRHPVVAGLSTTVMVALLAILIGGAWYQSQLNDTLKELENARATAVDHLYRALTSEAGYLNEVRPVGYGSRVDQLVSEARQLESTEKDERELRQLLISSLGHVAAHDPLELPKQPASVTAANVTDDGEHLLLGLESGRVVLLDLLTGEPLHTNNSLAAPVVKIDVNLNNVNREGTWFRTVGLFGREIADWTLRDGELVLASCHKPSLPEGFHGVEVTPDGEYLVGVIAAPQDRPRTGETEFPLADRGSWITRSTIRLNVGVDQGRRHSSAVRQSRFAALPLRGGDDSLILMGASISPRFDVSNHHLVVARSWLDDAADDGIREVGIYNLHSGKLEKEINPQCGSILNVMISPSGYYIACGGHFATEIYERHSGSLVARFDEFGSCMIEDFIGNDGDVLIRNDQGSIWCSPRSRHPIARIPSATDQSHLVASSDGRSLMRVATDNPQVIAMYGQQQHRITAHGRITKSVCFSGDGRLLMTSGEYFPGNLTRIWNTATCQYEFEFSGSDSVFSPDDRWVACWSGGLRLWNAATGKLVASAKFDSFPDKICFSESGDRIVMAGRFPGQLAAWQIETDASSPANTLVKLRPIELDAAGASPIALSPSGNRLAYLRGTEIRVHDFTEAEFSARITPPGMIDEDSLAFLDERRLLVTSDRLQLWDLSTRKVIRSTQRRYQSPITLSPDRRIILCRTELIRTDDFQSIFKLPTWVNSTVACDWSRDGRRIAYGFEGGEVSFWELPAVLQVVRDQQLPPPSLQFQDRPVSDAIDQMIEIGRRHAGEYAPEQWRDRYNNLNNWLDRADVRSDWVTREVNWLSDRLDRIGSRPFFPSQANASDFADRADLVYRLAMRLQERKQYAAEEYLLSAMRRAFEQLPSGSPQIKRKMSLLYHASGDLHNFHLRDEGICLNAYRHEEELLETLLLDSEPTVTPADLATNRFWLHRNRALALFRFGQPRLAAEEMQLAIKVAERFDHLDADPDVIRSARETVKQWKSKPGSEEGAESRTP